MDRRQILALLVAAVLLPLAAAGAVGRALDSTRVDVRIIADEAEAVLAILAKLRAGQSVGDADWRQLFASEGYVRLKRRESAMNRAFEDSEFRTFVLSGDLLARATALEETLRRWVAIDPSRAAARALAYLPKGATIRAKIYPSIKPRTNSFVFEAATDPAIFLYLDPTVSPERFENTLAHELHHIGLGGGCQRADAEAAKLPQNTQAALRWLGAFGEGLAMLAAAGGPDVHPHAVSPAEERERWDRDVARYGEDFRRVERFVLDLGEGRLDEAKERETGFSFVGEQGPWYTVGWRMAVTIEKTLGREALVDAFCDTRRLPDAYNRAAAEHNRTASEKLPLWSSDLAGRLAGAKR